MPKTLFIADLHLDKRYPKAIAAFLRYLQHLESQVADGEIIDALYILGDLFDYWVGDDCADKTSYMIAQGIRQCHEKLGVPVYFIHGNRDFLLAKDYAEQCAMQLLPEIKKIDLYGVDTVVMHGDTLCTDDKDYINFRNKVRSLEWQRKVLKWPIWLRRLKASQLRRQSKKVNRTKSDIIMDVSQKTLEKVMCEQGVKQLIHGHTHRPAIHNFECDGLSMRRCVVGDWYTQGSVLVVTADKIELTTLSLE
ncbi:MAG: UDP-2,3-diacylglucosamine diphosphatase [Ostreibacterium sp.]